MYPQVINVDNANHITDYGVFYNQNEGQYVANTPTEVSNFYQIYFVYTTSGCVTQIMRADNLSTGAKLWMRQYYTYGGWTSWKEISTDIPSFYKSYADLSSLANALGVKHIETHSQLEGTINGQGVYLFKQGIYGISPDPCSVLVAFNSAAVLTNTHDKTKLLLFRYDSSTGTWVEQQ